MKKFGSALFVSAILPIAMAQSNPPVPSAVSRAYEEYRNQPTEPTFGLHKVKALIKNVKADGDGNVRVSAQVFNSFSPSERFTYTMLNGENASQNCDEMPSLAGEEKMIFAHPPEPFSNGMAEWSDRQNQLLHKHRSQVIGFLRQTIRRRHRIGSNLKGAILELGAYELIPDMVVVYDRDKKDLDILSTFMVLMKDGKYKPFLAWPTYQSLYGDKANYQGHIDDNKSNRKLILARAMAYYRSRKG